MRNLNNRYYLFVIISLFTSLISCKQNEDIIEKNLMYDFLLLEPKLDQVINHVVSRYYSIGKLQNYNRLQFILSDKMYNKRNVFADTLITNTLQNFHIANITFEKGSFCLDRYEYDFVRFKLYTKGNFQYYYVYEFCPLFQGSVDGLNFKSVPLNSNWSLQIEKN